MANELDSIQDKLKNKGLPTDDTLQEEESQTEEVIVDNSDEIEEVEIEDESGDELEGVQEDSRSEEEIQASDSGWQPKEDWIAAGKDPEEWVTAKQFLRNGEYLRKIHNQNRKIKELDGVVGTLAKQQKKIFDAGYEKAKRELKAAARAALREGDDEQVEVIEQRIEALEEQRKEDLGALTVESETKENKQPKVAPEFNSWVQRNDWFIKHPDMRAYGEVVGLQHAQDNPEKTNAEIYEFVTKQVKQRFPERFGAMKKPEKKKTGSPVVGAGELQATRKSVGSSTRVSLTPEEKTVGRALIQRGAYKDMNEYATELKKFGVKG